MVSYLFVLAPWLMPHSVGFGESKRHTGVRGRDKAVGNKSQTGWKNQRMAVDIDPIAERGIVSVKSDRNTPVGRLHDRH